MGTGLSPMLDPAIVVALLPGADIAGVGNLLGRCFGIALFTLGLACWPSGADAANGSPAARAMLIYIVLIAGYLAFLGTAGYMAGPLLWPGVLLHAGVTASMIFTWRAG